MASTGGRGATLDAWQRQSVLAAATFLRERFSKAPLDPKARAIHDALLEVVEPARRALRLQREMQIASAGAMLTVKAERRGRGRRSDDRRVLDVGPPGGVERRAGERRAPRCERRARR
jgi:hypothetical protein